MNVSHSDSLSSDQKAPFRLLRKAKLKGSITEATNKVLHIDDDSSFCRLAACMLKSADYEVHSSTESENAIELIQAEKPAVVLLDICMTGRSGLQVLRDIQNYDRSIPVIMLTGLVGEKTLVDARALGAIGCVFKPIEDWSALSRMIEGALEQTHLWREALARVKAEEAADELV
ncbi:MAG: response regulator [Planctomycetota bacterium]